MLFMGNVLVKLSDVPNVGAKSDLDVSPQCRRHDIFTRIPALDDEASISRMSLDELSKRKDPLSRGFVEFHEVCRQHKSIMIMLKSDEWAESTGFLTSPISKCLFPRL
jgi:hypothetical protein